MSSEPGPPDTPINTLLVGMVLFDGARTVVSVSFNREARKTVKGRQQPGQSLEQLVLVFRRLGGR